MRTNLGKYPLQSFFSPWWNTTRYLKSRGHHHLSLWICEHQNCRWTLPPHILHHRFGPISIHRMNRTLGPPISNSVRSFLIVYIYIHNDSHTCTHWHSYDTYIYIHMINYTCIEHTVYPWHSHRYMYMLYIYIIASVPRHPMPCTSQPPGPDPRVCRDKLTNVRCWYNLIQPLKEGYLILLTNILVYHGISFDHLNSLVPYYSAFP